MFIEQVRSCPLRRVVYATMGIYTIIIVTGLTVYLAVASRVNTMTWGECRDEKRKDSMIECCVLENKQVEPINKNKYMCCAGKVHRHSNYRQCCYNPANDDSVYYDRRKSVCCNGKLHNITDSNRRQCCGDTLYNNKTQLCCPIDHQMQISYHVFEKQSYSICPVYYCNKEPYDKSEKTCCNGKILLAKSNHYCCGDRLYNNELQVCCNDRIHRKRDEYEGCCVKRYMRKDEKCCGNKVIKKTEDCCGGKTYNSSQDKCIADSRIVPIDTPLCANREYKPKTHVCCGSFPMIKRNQEDNACCKARGHQPGTTFNNKIMRCVNGKLRSIVRCGRKHTPDMYTCCNNYAYDQPAENSVCCDGRAEWYRPGPDQDNCRPPRCNGEWYDDKHEECCDNKLINKRKYRCISQTAYRYYNRNDHLFSNLRKCGNYAISKDYACCANVMPYKYNHYNCPISNFRNERPIKPSNYPFWPLLKCQSKELSARITDAKIEDTKITIYLREKRTGKTYYLNVSSSQEKTIKKLKTRNALINVYYEKSLKNELFLGEYGAIELRRFRRLNRVTKSTCAMIDRFFEKS